MPRLIFLLLIVFFSFPSFAAALSPSALRQNITQSVNAFANASDAEQGVMLGTFALNFVPLGGGAKFAANLLAKDVAKTVVTTAEKTAVKAIISRIENIVAPGGKLIGKTGSSETIRELSGGVSAAQKKFQELIRDATPVIDGRYSGDVRYELPDGGSVGLRVDGQQSLKSTSAGVVATIDVKTPNFNFKLKYKQ